MTSILDSRCEPEVPSLASQIHDIAQNIMDADNETERKSTDSIIALQAVVDANIAKLGEAKKQTEERWMETKDNETVRGIHETAAGLKARAEGLADFRASLESRREDVRQSAVATERLAAATTEAEGNRDVEVAIGTKKAAVVDEHISAVNSLLALYQNHLGLTITRGGGGDLSFSFTRLDPRSHSRAFSLRIHLHPATKEYAFVSATPPSNESHFRSLVTELNRSNNLQKFLCRARKLFLDSIQASS